ncbi:hypothetical protein M9Y10_009475 [Tritrichomonas musculus]|uniref:Rho-GAP domain-containing protein n=1 Tax=Tritrichomonas musculus TaxID=1915356 RepID=A0ABR2INL2_9EUKA
MSSQTTRPIFFHILINAPRLCKSMNMNVKNDERIFDLIYRIVNNAGLIETNQYKLYGLADNFVEIPSESLCSSLFLTSYDSLYLFDKAEEHLIISTVYFDTRKTIVTADMHSESTRLVSMAVKCLKIPIDGTFYVLYNPKTYEIYPFDEAIFNKEEENESNLFQEENGKQVHLKFVLKQFCSFISQFIFCPTLINSDPSTDENSTNQKWQDLISKEKITLFMLNDYFIPPTFKNLLSKVHDKIMVNIQNSKEPLVLSKLDFQKVNSIINNYDNENCIDTLTEEESNSFLFYLLSMYQKSYISDTLHEKIIQIMLLSKNQTNSTEEGEKSIEIFYKVRAVLSLMPICTQCILLKLCQCFELIPTNKSLIQLITRSMLPASVSKNREAEEKFFAFVLSFYEFLFELPNSNHILMKTKEGRLKIESISNLNSQKLTQFQDDRNIFDVLESLVDKNKQQFEQLNDEKFNKLNITLEDISQLEERKKELMKKIKEKLDE